VEALRELLDRRAAELAQRMDTGDEGEEDGTDAAAGMQHGLLSGEDDPYLQAKDPSECTPLHLAIIGGAHRPAVCYVWACITLSACYSNSTAAVQQRTHSHSVLRL
jgi:hypothetical protein